MISHDAMNEPWDTPESRGLSHVRVPQRDLNRSRGLGRPDTFPQRDGQLEDELSKETLTHGYTCKYVPWPTPLRLEVAVGLRTAHRLYLPVATLRACSHRVEVEHETEGSMLGEVRRMPDLASRVC